MTTPAHYPYSATYLRERMARFSAYALFGIAALIVVAIVSALGAP
jgi:hypothetical protein